MLLLYQEKATIVDCLIVFESTTLEDWIQFYIVVFTLNSKNISMSVICTFLRLLIFSRFFVNAHLRVKIQIA